MSLLIILFGFLIVIAGAFLTVKSKLIIGFLESNKKKVWLYSLAIVVRAILGICLITQSALSKFPAAIEVLGWISLTAAIVISVIGHSVFQQLLVGIVTRLKLYAHMGGLVSIIFGLFLIYAFI